MLEGLKGKIANVAGRTGLKVKKYTPEILIGTGVIGFVGTVIMASNATLKVEEVLDEHTMKIDLMKEAREVGVTRAEETYSEEDYKKDMVITYTQTGIEFVKLYGPAVTLGLLSIASFLTAHKVMKGRNLAIAAAYKALEVQYENYRKRVVEVYGEQQDYDFKNGIRRELVTVEEVNEETGRKRKVKKEIEVKDSAISEYAVLFNNHTSEMWSRVQGSNALFLKYAREEAQLLLDKRGHVFLNEVYDILGMEHTQPGAVTGWARGNGDDYIDFDVHELNSKEDLYDSYDINKEIDIVLDFNVDGLIMNLI